MNPLEAIRALTAWMAEGLMASEKPIGFILISFSLLSAMLLLTLSPFVSIHRATGWGLGWQAYEWRSQTWAIGPYRICLSIPIHQSACPEATFLPDAQDPSRKAPTCPATCGWCQGEGWIGKPTLRRYLKTSEPMRAYMRGLANGAIPPEVTPKEWTELNHMPHK